MASKYGAATTLLVLNTRPITNFSKKDEPIQIETLDDKRELDIHYGGGAIITERIYTGCQLTVSVTPNSPDGAWFSGVYESGEVIEGQLVSMGSGEKILMSEGFVTKIGDVGRGHKPSDDEYIIKFVVYLPKMGSSSL